MIQIEKEIEGQRKGMKMKEMPISEAYALLKDAYDEYYKARYMVARAKRGKSKFVRDEEKKADMIKNRVENIFMTCPKLWEYVKEDFFQPNYFKSDFAELMRTLKNEFES